MIRRLDEVNSELSNLIGYIEMLELQYLKLDNGKYSVESVIALCYTHHHGTMGVHGREGKELDRTLKIRLQETYKEQGYSEDEIRTMMGGKLY